MKASDIMTMGAATTTATSSLAAAIKCMSDHGISALPVLDEDGHLQGIVTEGDFFRQDLGPFRLDALVGIGAEERARSLGSMTVAEIMSTQPITVDGGESLEEAIAIMEGRGVKRLPVTSHGKLVGLLSRADILRALITD
ncbi:CBS domain-containing protein [Sphingobium bisphenolivorans]|uniref:CBS domain-containing protein n=1 Tax=Sphingobium bisphenolivorans TaxID=1335760 RepID=UPI0003A42A61|nr:CBS domain-containing protein [Sphingobium bisphenolivorans]